MPFSNTELAHTMWVFTGGAILVLLQSILQGTKRRWWSLLIGCAFGGAGSWVAAQIWGDSKYVYIICGVAAVVTENVLIGVVNASKQFADSPIKVGSQLAKMFFPTFGKSVGDNNTDAEGLK